ncbi:MAG: DUF4170 domain-containing protein [Alphaproteobacteria bacterium]
MTTSDSAQKFFYVVGGEYADLTFENLLTKTSTFKGPFAERKMAEDQWRTLSHKGSGDPLVKYEIIEIFHKIDSKQLFGLAPKED